MKKYKLNLSIRKGMVETAFDEYEIDTEHFTEMFTLSKLATFKDDAYLVVSLEEIPEPIEA
jgi:hypothetical protein